MYPTDASPNGKYVLQHEVTGPSGYDIGMVPLAAPDHPSSFLSTRFNEIQARDPRARGTIWRMAPR